MWPCAKTRAKKAHKVRAHRNPPQIENAVLSTHATAAFSLFQVFARVANALEKTLCWISETFLPSKCKYLPSRNKLCALLKILFYLGERDIFRKRNLKRLGTFENIIACAQKWSDAWESERKTSIKNVITVIWNCKECKSAEITNPRTSGSAITRAVRSGPFMDNRLFFDTGPVKRRHKPVPFTNFMDTFI